MKLLIVTQKVDKNDPILGFFHRWIEEFAKHYERLIVICLEKGESTLPENVKVLSLGKEIGNTKFDYICWFYQYIWDECKNYDAVFVHMNQEYVLLGWKFWKLWGKKVYLWRNHAKGNFLTDLAGKLSHKVFYTSTASYTAKFKNSVRMPVGVDTEFFKPDTAIKRIVGSVLFLGRISPVKMVLEFLDWLENRDCSQATIAGPIGDKKYGELVLSRTSQHPKIKYVGPVNQAEALKLYQTHETYVNFTEAGSLDKTIFEAAACGMKLVVRNPDAQNFNIAEHSLKVLMEKLREEIK